MKFEIGDIVRLNSGSPPLLVVDIDGDNLTVAWPKAERVEEITLPGACFRPSPREMAPAQ